MNEIFSRCGGTALRTDNPLHRFWRDANAGLNHACFNTGYIYHASAAIEMGVMPDAIIPKAMI